MLTLRRTALASPAYRDWADYIIVEDGRGVGRLYEDRHSKPELRWFWSITVYVNPKSPARKASGFGCIAGPAMICPSLPLIVEALAGLRSRSCIIDDEAVSCGDDGISSFDRIRYVGMMQTFSCGHSI